MIEVKIAKVFSGKKTLSLVWVKGLNGDVELGKCFRLVGPMRSVGKTRSSILSASPFDLRGLAVV